MPDLSLDFRLFRYALASAEYGSFRRAAAALNIQQSSVSRGVRTLEHRIGADLFQRSHAGIRPTPAGERFLQEAALGFEHLERAMRWIGAAQRGEHGELTVAASVPFPLLGDVFERFRSEHSGVSLEVVEETCAGGVTLLRQRRADIAFVTKVPVYDGMQSLHLRDERIAAVLPKSHRLAGARVATLGELGAERIILGAGGLGPVLADDIERQLAKSNNTPDLHLLRVSQCNLISMVAQGFGISIVVGRFSRAGPDDIVLVPLAGRSKKAIHAVWLQSTNNPARKYMLKIARALHDRVSAK